MERVRLCKISCFNPHAGTQDGTSPNQPWLLKKAQPVAGTGSCVEPLCLSLPSGQERRGVCPWPHLLTLWSEFPSGANSLACTGCDILHAAVRKMGSHAMAQASPSPVCGNLGTKDCGSHHGRCNGDATKTWPSPHREEGQTLAAEGDTSSKKSRDKQDLKKLGDTYLPL